MIPLYILGLLLRFGPQHGYQIKKIIAEQLSDFTQIKLPTIYYHLEKMERESLLSSNNEKPGSRPEKTVYAITEKGRKSFRDKLTELLEFKYRPIFSSDAVFYFSEYKAENREIAVHLKKYIQELHEIIDSIEKHKKETLQYIPDDLRTMANIIFSHHKKHYQAELDWAAETLKSMEGE